MERAGVVWLAAISILGRKRNGGDDELDAMLIALRTLCQLARTAATAE